MIDVEGIQSFPIDRSTAEWVAHHPYWAANVINVTAIGSEALSGGVTGATINTSITILLQSIKLVGSYCRGEATLTPDQIKAFQTQVLEALSTGFMRGAAVKLLQRLLGGNAFAALGLAVGAEAVPALIEILNNQLTLDEAIQRVGPRALTAGMLTTVVLLIPPLGAALFTVSLLQAVWAELTPEFKQYVVQWVEASGRAARVGIHAGQSHLHHNPWDLFGASSASSTASSAELSAMQDELDALLE